MPSFNPSLEVKILSLVLATALVFGIAKLVYPPTSGSPGDQQAGPPPNPSGNNGALNSSLGNSRQSQIARLQQLVENEDSLSYRLPDDVVPFKYFLRIQPIIPTSAEASGDEFDPYNLTLYTAPGEARIGVEVKGVTNKIVLHELSIVIHEDSVKVFKLKSSGDVIDYEDLGLEIGVVGHEYDIFQNFYSVELEEDLEVGGKYLLVIPFTSTISQQHTNGMFLTFYDDGPDSKLMLSTKFQATHARQAFPCFDEPKFKAEFEIVIGRHGNYQSLSNAPLRSTTENSEMPGWFWDHYEPSLRMSSYLVCYAVMDYEHQSAHESLSNGREIKVWAPKTLVNKNGAIYAANLTARVMSFLEEYFNMTDSLTKVDSIMIPNFRTSAMENWGLITYKETMLIYVPGENTEFRRRIVTTVVAHELSHHWFGNLVTCDWWSDVWLNEGFATYLSYMVMEHLTPEFEPESEFVDDVLQLSMQTDPHSMTWPVRNSARSQDEVDSAFSRTSYRKGASIIRMVASFLGKERFRTALQNFLRKHAFGTAVQDDLFHELNGVGEHLLPPGVTIKDVMDTWTLKSSFPLVRVEVLDSTTIRITQQKISNSATDQAPDTSATWWIPITYVTPDSIGGNASALQSPIAWIPSNQTSITLRNVSTSSWMLINYNYNGYFSVLYDSKLTGFLKEQLESDHTAFNTITRSQILFDYMTCAQAGYIPLETALDLTKYLENEVEFIPWNAVLPFFSELGRRLRASKTSHTALVNYLVPKIEKILNLPQVGFQANRFSNDTITILLLRAELLNLACQLESEFCYSQARKLLQQWIDAPDVYPIPINMENILICAMVKAGGVAGWEFMLQKSKQPEKNEHLHWWYFRSLTCAESEDLILRTLEVYSNSSLGIDVRLGGLNSLARNKYSMAHTFNHILTRFESNSSSSSSLENGETPGSAPITPDIFLNVISTLGGYLYKREDIQRLREFVGRNQEKLGNQLESLGIAMESMEDNHSWMTFYGSMYTRWFQQNS